MKSTMLLTVLAGLLSVHQADARNNSTQLPEHIKSVTAVSQVYGDGAKVSTIAVEYDAPIRQRSLSADAFAVEGKEITAVYANTAPERAERGRDGSYVIIELRAATDLNGQPPTPSAESLEARRRIESALGPGLKAGYSLGGDAVPSDSVSIRQLATLRTVKGARYAPTPAFGSTAERCLVADDFRQLEFKSPFSGQTLPYNLYLPADYDPSVSYPLVLFIHDAGVTNAPVRTPLLQGRGAVVWAEPEWQAKHPCIVVAPQYPVVTVDDDWNYSHHLDTTLELLRDLQTRYSIDPDRIYTTGQSMGCMSSMVMMLKQPRLFAGALLVAGKWTPDVLAPLSAQNLWIVSCEGDRSSTELQGKAADLWRANGNTVSEATWDMTSTAEEFEEAVAEMRRDDVHLYYTHLTGGSHRATWFVAYDIEGIREWLFSQRRRDPLDQPTAKTDWIDPVRDVAVNCRYLLYPTTQRGDGTEGSLMVYLPDGYEQGTQRYPVIYYLHGGTGNQREGRWMISRIHKAIGEGRMKPVIVVCPQAMPIGWYVNGNMADPNVLTGPIEDVLIKDMIPYIDSHFRTVASREGRGIEGFSMGGGATMRLAFKYPDLFCAASSVAGAVVHWDEEPLQRSLEGTFGSISNPSSRAYFDSQLPEVFARQNASAIINSGMRVRMFVGTADRLYEENGTHITQRFSDFLDSLRIPHTLQMVPRAHHDPGELFAAGVNEYDTTFWDESFGR